MITLSITQFIITLLSIPLCIVSVYYLYKIGFFYDEEEVKPFEFITLQDNEGEKTK